MAKQLLDGTQVGTAVKKMGGKGVAQCVRADILDYLGLDQAGFQITLHAAWGQTTATGIQKQGGIIPGGAPGFKIGGKSFMGLTTDRQDSFLASFADHPDQLFTQIE